MSPLDRLTLTQSISDAAPTWSVDVCPVIDAGRWSGQSIETKSVQQFLVVSSLLVGGLQLVCNAFTISIFYNHN